MLLFRLLGRGFMKLFKGLGYLGKFSSVIPVGIFIVTDFFINLFRSKSFPYAFLNMAKTVFSAELVINEKVHQAIVNVQGYNLIDVFQILISLYILYALVRFFSNLIVKVAGGQALYGSYFIAIIIVAIIEVSAIAVIDGKLGFIPIKDGVIFLLMNLQPVFTSIIGYSSNIAPQILNSTMNVTNSTIMSIGLFFKRKGI